jgi:hypothetical protein
MDRKGSAMASVAQSANTQQPFIWTRGIAARETLSYLDRNKIDAEPLLLKADLLRAQVIQDPVLRQTDRTPFCDAATAGRRE